MTFDLLSFRSSSGHKKESNPGNECAILELVPFKKIRNSSAKTAKKKLLSKKRRHSSLSPDRIEIQDPN